MKKMLIVAALAAVLPQLAAAQVEKQVEVTKAYVPKVESASKLAVQPDMTDTARMRPETVTYWEFNRPLPFYLKAGAGYPLNSVLDFYASSQNPSTGYVVGYVNHEGRYADIKNDFGVKNNSTRMFNRIGAAAGKYFGRHIRGLGRRRRRGPRDRGDERLRRCERRGAFRRQFSGPEPHEL